MTRPLHLIPAAPPACPDCGSVHHPAAPHNALSIFYGVSFAEQHGRDPDWRDAMEHCDDDVRERWRAALHAAGIEIDAGHLHPSGVRA